MGWEVERLGWREVGERFGGLVVHKRGATSGGNLFEGGSNNKGGWEMLGEVERLGLFGGRRTTSGGNLFERGGSNNKWGGGLVVRGGGRRTTGGLVVVRRGVVVVRRGGGGGNLLLRGLVGTRNNHPCLSSGLIYCNTAGARRVVFMQAPWPVAGGRPEDGDHPDHQGVPGQAGRGSCGACSGT